MNVGLDVGYSAVKAISGDRRIIFPSVVGTADRARFSLNGTGGDEIILTEPISAAIGAGAVMQSRHLKRREDRAWIESDEWYLLVLAGLTGVTLATSVALRIVTGLPLAFYSDKDRVRQHLLGEHRAARRGRRAQVLKVSDCRVIPQPFGALLAETLDDRGHITNKILSAGHVGVIDIGGKTTNLLSVRRLSEISRETASISVGVWDVARHARDYLSKNCPDLELRDHQVMEAIVTRRVSYFGEQVNMAQIIDDALAPMAQQVISEATQLWNGAAGLDIILVSGGGALLLGPMITDHYRHARVVDDPVFANALGFWRFSQRLGC